MATDYKKGIFVALDLVWPLGGIGVVLCNSFINSEYFYLIVILRRIDWFISMTERFLGTCSVDKIYRPKSDNTVWMILALLILVSEFHILTFVQELCRCIFILSDNVGCALLWRYKC